MSDGTTRDFCGEALKSAGIKSNGFSNSDRGNRHESLHDEDGNDTLWPTMDEAAYHGLAGDIVRTIGPHTEADPVAILLQALVYFGNQIGNSAYYQVEADAHHANLFVVLVGQVPRDEKVHQAVVRGQ
jgi:hypothetical protein